MLRDAWIYSVFLCPLVCHCIVVFVLLDSLLLVSIGA